MKNLKQKPLHVYHASLAVLEAGTLRRMCPVCPDGMLVLERDPATLKVKREDRCLACGQAFVFDDEPLAAPAPLDAENKRLRELNQAAADRLHEITREANGKFRYAERVHDVLHRLMAAAATVFSYGPDINEDPAASAWRDYCAVHDEAEQLLEALHRRTGNDRKGGWTPEACQAAMEKLGEQQMSNPQSFVKPAAVVNEVVERFGRYFAAYETACLNLEEARLPEAAVERRSDALAHWAQQRDEARALLFHLVVKNGAAITELLRRGSETPKP